MRFHLWLQRLYRTSPPATPCRQQPGMQYSHDAPYQATLGSAARARVSRAEERIAQPTIKGAEGEIRKLGNSTAAQVEGARVDGDQPATAAPATLRQLMQAESGVMAYQTTFLCGDQPIAKPPARSTPASSAPAPSSGLAATHALGNGLRTKFEDAFEVIGLMWVHK